MSGGVGLIGVRGEGRGGMGREGGLYKELEREATGVIRVKVVYHCIKNEKESS